MSKEGEGRGMEFRREIEIFSEEVWKALKRMDIGSLLLVPKQGRRDQG